MKFTKSLKVVLCCLLVLSCGGIFIACGEDKNLLTFDSSMFVIYGGDGYYTYNGQSYIFSVVYGNKEIDVSYSLDKKDFKKDLQLIDTNTYQVYFKVSAEGYKDYVSSEPITVRIVESTLEIKIDDITLNEIPTIEPNYTSTIISVGIAQRDETEINEILNEITYVLKDSQGQEIEFADVEPNTIYTIEGILPDISENLDKNYNISLINGTFSVIA